MTAFIITCRVLGFSAIALLITMLWRLNPAIAVTAGLLIAAVVIEGCEE